MLSYYPQQAQIPADYSAAYQQQQQQMPLQYQQQYHQYPLVQPQSQQQIQQPIQTTDSPTYYQTPLPLPQQQHYFQTQPNYYFEKNEVLYPDYTTYPNPGDLQAPYTVYNLNRKAQVSPFAPDFHVYEPNNKRVSSNQSNNISQNTNNREVNTEDILRKNTTLWNLYQSGRFEIIQNFELKEKKIVLREKTTSSDPKYTVKKFKVPFSTSQGGQDDGHILLVSFSNSQLEPNQHIHLDHQTNLVTSCGGNYTDDHIQHKKSDHVIRKVESIDSLGKYDEPKLTGPGSKLVARLVEGTSSYSQSLIYDENSAGDAEFFANDDNDEEVEGNNTSSNLSNSQ